MFLCAPCKVWIDTVNLWTEVPDLYPGSGIYAGPCFYQIILKLLRFVANALAYSSYCIRLTLLEITASAKYLMPVTYKQRLDDFQKPFLNTAMCKLQYKLP